MCSYNITLNDALVEEVRPAFPNDDALRQWLQQQIESMLLEMKAQAEKRAVAKKAIEAMRQQSEENGNSGLSLAEIDEEIRLSRQERGKANRR
ncbi:MAG: hypothetical protein IJQ11_13255 [Bacteroidales bacterium]|nr:hypothetical protein [Bacteroidales bacterium]